MKIVSTIFFGINVLIFPLTLLLAFLSGMVADAPGSNFEKVTIMIMSWILPLIVFLVLIYSRKANKILDYKKSLTFQSVLFVYYFFHFFILINLG